MDVVDEEDRETAPEEIREERKRKKEFWEVRARTGKRNEEKDKKMRREEPRRRQKRSRKNEAAGYLSFSSSFLCACVELCDLTVKYRASGQSRTPAEQRVPPSPPPT